MIRQNIRRLVKPDFLMLLPLLGLAFYTAYIPHINYPYPLHVDEWVHLAYSKAMMQSGSTTFLDPFYGQSMVGLSSNLEAGFHLFLGTFQAISGVSWMDIFRYLPAVIFTFTVLSVYIMARREGFGWEAAFFTCLIPTTVGILGPAFLVPVSVGLLFTPLILFIALNFSSIWHYLLIFGITCFLLSIHAPSAICPIIILVPYILLNLKGNHKHSLLTALALLLPFFVVFPWISDLLLPTARSLLTQRPPTEYVQLPKIIETYGYLPILFCLLGTFSLAIKGGKKNYGLILGLLALLLMLLTFYTFHYGVAIVYERGLMYMMLMLGIVAGAGLSAVKNLHLPANIRLWKGLSPVMPYLGRALCLIFVGIILAVTIPVRLDADYYRMIDKEDYQAFVWIRDNIGADYQRAVLDPWKATAFTAITGKYIYSRIHASPQPGDLEAYQFLHDGCSDTAFLRENGISIVYSQGLCSNPDLVEVRQGVYILPESGE